MTYWRCPYRWYLSKIMGLRSTKPRTAANFGTVFAEVSRRYYANWPARSTVDTWEVAREYKLESEDAYTLAALWPLYCAWSERNERWEELRPELSLEVPLDFMGRPDDLFTCRVDLLAKLDGEWHVRDLKTTTRVDVKKGDIDPQTVMAYPWAIKQALGIDVVGASMLFVRRVDPA